MFETTIRPFQSSDFAFCRDSFYKGASQAPGFRAMDQNIKKPGFRERFSRFEPFAEISLITHPEQEPIYGWIAVTNLETISIVWWVYVKGGYRRFGFARQLWNHAVKNNTVHYPFRSISSEKLGSKVNATFNPFVYEDLCFENQENSDIRASHSHWIGWKKDSSDKGQTEERLR